MHRFILLMFVMMPFFTSAAFPQSVLWEKRYGEDDTDESRCVRQTTDGGFVLTGITMSFGAGQRDVWLLRTDVDGDTLWTKTFGGSENDWGRCVQQTADGGFILIGFTYSFGAGSYDVWLLRTDVDGDTLWTKTFGGSANEWGYCVQQTADGGFVLTGCTESFGPGGKDLWLIRTDQDGDTIWTKEYGGSDWDEGQCVQQTTDGGFIVTGTTESFGAGSWDVWLLKTDVDGDTLWTKTFGGSGTGDWGYTVQQTTDGGFIVAGVNTGKPWLIRTDVDGDTLWTRTFGGGRLSPVCAQETKDGGFILSCQNTSYPGYASLIRTDETGDVLWEINVPDCVPYFVGGTADAAFIVTGHYLGTDYDVWLAKVKDSFRPNPHGWQFANNGTNPDPPYNGDPIMWPEYWWSQFNYTQYPYPPELFQDPDADCQSGDFPDWPLFAEAFENQCWWELPDGRIAFSLEAFYKWRGIALGNRWEDEDNNLHYYSGACFGFAISSLLYYNDYLSFPGYNTLYEVPLSNESRELVNKYWLYQHGRQHREYLLTVRHKEANETLNELRQMLSTEQINNRALRLKNQSGSGAHAVVATRVKQDINNPSVWHVYIYDSNDYGGGQAPPSEGVIDINTSSNTWYYDKLPNWGGHEGLHLRDPIDTYLSTPILTQVYASDFIEVYNSGYCDILITNSDGDSIGYSHSDSTLIDSMANAMPIIPETGFEHPPIGYFLPKNAYTCQVSNSVDSVFYFSVLGDSSAFYYGRRDFQPGQRDDLRYLHGDRRFEVKTEDVDTKTITLKGISIQPDGEMVCDMRNLALSQHDSLQLEIVEQTEFKLTNMGGPKAYDLMLELASADLNPFFEHDSIPLSDSSAHQVSPDWEGLDTIPVMILIDNGLNGVFEETLFVENQYEPFIRGDANGDGQINLADAVYIVNYLFIGGPPPDPLEAGDANCSGDVDLADAVYIINWLFIGGPPPGC